jgi:hypothetical protein
MIQTGTFEHSNARGVRKSSSTRSSSSSAKARRPLLPLQAPQSGSAAASLLPFSNAVNAVLHECRGVVERTQVAK